MSNDWLFSFYAPHLFRHTVVVDLQCILLFVIVWRNNDPNHNNNLTYKKKQPEKQIEQQAGNNNTSLIIPRVLHQVLCFLSMNSVNTIASPNSLQSIHWLSCSLLSFIHWKGWLTAITYWWEAKTFTSCSLLASYCMKELSY